MKLYDKTSGKLLLPESDIQRFVGDKFGVNLSLIHKIVTREVWKHI